MKELTYLEMGLLPEEYEKIITILKREPNYLELGMYAVMWSEHCGYKNSKPLLKLLPTTGSQVLQGPGENAGIIDIGDGQAVVFKLESHNHPSAIEPYQGAATGVGGIVRDIFTMGARPIAILDSLRFGLPDNNRVKELFAGVVAGIAGYGNCLGIPTVGGEVYFNSCYQDNPLVNAMCVGLVNHDEIALAVAGEVGSSIMLVGSKTGRDGIHGATFASEELTESSQQKRPAVQVGDPFMEKLLIEACLDLIKKDLVQGMQDLGAAGLTSSIAETVSKSGQGVEVDVLLVPRRETGMSAYEIMLSESQERMLIVPRAGKEAEIRAIFDKWGLDATVIGKVTDDGFFRVLSGDKLEAAVPVLSLTDDCPIYVRQGIEPDYFKRNQEFSFAGLEILPDDAALLKLLESPNIADKAWVFRQYDHQVMANSVVLPGVADAAVLRVKDTCKGIALTTDGNSRMVYLDPFQGGQAVVCEAARNLACVGALPLGLTNCLNFGNPEKPQIFWQMENAVKGMAKAAEYLEIPVVSGNVSLYNESTEAAIYPTPVVGMVGLLKDISKRTEMAFKQEDNEIILLGGTSTDLGGSEYLAFCYGIESGAVPKVNLENEKNLVKALLSLHEKQYLLSCHDISDGGLAIALTESAILGGIGFFVNIEAQAKSYEVLFAEGGGRAIISVSPENSEMVVKIAAEHDVAATRIGKVSGKSIRIDFNSCPLINISLSDAESKWKESIPCIMK